MTYSTFRPCVLVLCGLLIGCGSDSRPVNAPPVQPKSAKATPAAGRPEVPEADVSPSEARAEAAASRSLDAFRARLVRSQEQVDRTLASLKDLTDAQQADARGAYDRYTDQVARMNEEAQSVKIEADAMRAAREEYFGQWEERVAEIDNPTIRASAEARRKRLRDAHERIAVTSAEARDAYQPFMKNLQDIKKYLATDTSKSEAAVIDELAKQVQTDGAILKQKLQTVIATLDSVEGGER